MTDLSAGWEALHRGRWDEALEHFRGGENDLQALEAVGVAQWWLDDADATLQAREGAYRLYRAAGDGVGAARVAQWGGSREKGTLREHQPGHARPRAVTRFRQIPSLCGIFLPVVTRVCPRVPFPPSMVRRGSPVRVRQRASSTRERPSPERSGLASTQAAVVKDTASTRRSGSRSALCARRDRDRTARQRHQARVRYVGCFQATHVVSCRARGHMVTTITVSILDSSSTALENEHRRMSRARLLAQALVAGGSVVAGGIAIGGLPGVALGRSSPEQDVRVLNVLLLLEYVQAAFYAEANKRGSLRGELADFSHTVGEHENEHVVFLQKTLGSRARAKPRVDFRGATQSAQAFTTAAIALEDLGVAAYNGQATNVTRTTLAAAATIVSVEARHAAWIRDIALLLPAVAPVDPSATEAQMLQRLRKTGYLGSP